MKPSISLVVPAYNTASYLERCLNSIANQTYRNFEVILVDDASTDDTSQILAEYQRKLPSCKLVTHDTNKGLSAARNSGIKFAENDFIGFVDSDDWISPTMLQSLSGAIEKTGCDIAQIQYLITPNDNARPPKRSGTIRTLAPKEALREMFELEQYAVWNRLYKRTLLDGFTDDAPCFPVGLTCEDRVANAKLIPRSHSVAVSDSVEYFYFLNLNSISNSGLTSQGFDLLKADKLVVDLIRCLEDQELLDLAQDRAAKGAFSLLIKWARYGVTDEALDETSSLIFLKNEFELNYEKMMKSDLGAAKKSVAWLLKHSPTSLKALFRLYDKLPHSVKRR